VLRGHVEAAGRKTLTPETLIAKGMRFFSHFLDVEGKRVGLRSMN
jgi:hypothetical protein